MGRQLPNDDEDDDDDDGDKNIDMSILPLNVTTVK